MNEKVKPTRTYTNQPGEDYREDHPAYGMIGASRVSATPGANLFGSDFRHGNYVVISIHRASLSRGLSGDHHRAEGVDLIEVALSEAQWASFVSAMNVGHGVPCTIQVENGKWLPQIERDGGDRRTQLNDEVRQTLADALDELARLRDDAPSKKYRDRVEQAMQQIRSNLPFVISRFDEHAETTVEKAKMEVNAYVTQSLQRAGMTALASAQAPILLEGEDEPSPIASKATDGPRPDQCAVNTSAGRPDDWCHYRNGHDGRHSWEWTDAR
jgi:hypothetical protein